MRTKFTRFLRKGLLFSGLAGASFLMYNCSSKDLEFIDPFEFVYDFGEVEMDSVEDPEPSFDEPDTGEVTGSVSTQAIIEDVTTATAVEDIDASTRTGQESINDFSQGLSTEVLQIAAGLDATGAAAILNADNELDSELASLATQLSGSTGTLQELLPSIDFSCSAEDGQEVAKALNKGQIVTDSFGLEPVAQSTLFGPCVDAAEEAYDEAVAGVALQRDENITLIESNESTRLSDADTRFDARFTQQQDDYTSNEAALLATVEGLISAVDAAVALGDTDLTEELQLLALFYAVNGRTDLQEWNAAVVECLEALQAEEIATIEQLADDRTAQVLANYNSATAEVDSLLADALNNCHNQGAGN